MISQAGSYIAGIHLIVDGVVSDSLPPLSVGHRSHEILSRGDLIGLESLARRCEPISPSLCRALTPVELLFVETTQWLSVMRDDPAIQHALLHHLVSRYMRVRESSRCSRSVEVQLCRLLSRLASSCAVSQSADRVVLPAEITFQTLSELMGVSGRQFRQARQIVNSLSNSDACIAFDIEEVRQIASSA